MPIEPGVMVVVCAEQGLNVLFYADDSQSSIECEYNNDITLEDMVLSPKYTTSGSFGFGSDMAEVHETVNREGQERTVAKIAKRHPQNPR